MIAHATIPGMDITLPTPLLAGLSAQTFMRRHWQKKPLLIRQALPGIQPPVSRSELFALAGRDDVDSRLIVHQGAAWTLRHGPLTRRQIPPSTKPGWTLLVQGVDLLLPAAHQLLSQFRFVPDARLDDLMVSYASDAGGVGPHFDSYDVFLLQVQGTRRWRIGRMTDATLQPDVPLKILANFQSEEEMTLEPGDMLYLPPRWAHDGVAQGECMTCSIGFRAPNEHEVAREIVQRLLETETDDAAAALYRDPRQAATDAPARVPDALQAFANDAVAAMLRDPKALACTFGEWLSEPKSQVWFDEHDSTAPLAGVRLDRRSRMLYDHDHVFINGESFRASGRDAALMRRLADSRALDAAAMRRLSPGAGELVAGWVQAGWLHASDETQ
jgi:50S ribosomal protein L16 3-hydroxylase